jgi:type IV fimbrial biogenesis protein FimT
MGHAARHGLGIAQGWGILIARPMVKRPRGFTLIELMVVITIMALMVIMFAPNMAVWIANSKMRGTAESLASELRLAQVEALRRNRQAVFALTNAPPALDATPTANGVNWFVRALPTAAELAEASFDPAPLYVHGSNQASLARASIQGPALLCFNAVGQPTRTAGSPVGGVTACAVPANGANPVAYTVTRPGADRQLEVQVALGGMVRLCDPDKSLADGHADACR